MTPNSLWLLFRLLPVARHRRRSRSESAVTYRWSRFIRTIRLPELTPEQAKHILGVQANLWTEYILTDKHLEYMLLPRLAALSEVQWCQPE